MINWKTASFIFQDFDDINFKINTKLNSNIYFMKRLL